jgi:hypothetical protein
MIKRVMKLRLNEVALNYAKRLYGHYTPVKKKWIGEMTRQLHCTVEAIDAGNQKIKSILETKYGNGKRLSTKMLRFC